MSTGAKRALGVVGTLLALVALFVLLRRGEPGGSVAAVPTERRAPSEHAVGGPALAGGERPEESSRVEDESERPSPVDDARATTGAEEASGEAEAPEAPSKDTLVVVLVASDGRALSEAVGESQIATLEVATTREPVNTSLPIAERWRVGLCGKFRRKLGRDPTDRQRGTITLKCERPVWVSLVERGDVVASKLVGPGEDEVVFVLDPEVWAARFASVRFCAVNARTGEPVKGIHPCFTFETGGSRSVSAGDDGCVDVRGLPPGALTLDLVAWRYENARRRLVLARGEERDLGVVRMEPAEAATVRVVVRRPDDASEILLHAMLAAALVDEESAPPSGMAMPIGEEASTELRLWEGRWALWATATVGGEAWRSATEDVELGTGLTEIALEIVAAFPVELRTFSSSGVVRIVDSSGFEVQKAVVDPDRPTTVRLVPGSYELRLLGGEGETERVVPFTVGENGATVDVP